MFSVDIQADVEQLKPYFDVHLKTLVDKQIQLNELHQQLQLQQNNQLELQQQFLNEKAQLESIITTLQNKVSYFEQQEQQKSACLAKESQEQHEEQLRLLSSFQEHIYKALQFADQLEKQMTSDKQ
eukprot:TRINITY_DN8342_c0_g1_i1.p2 TRINITY_DN8342_c0_g1~~TRINITY_DN8342_c0_g1_i1.p2  ORF type:complete len:126 (-),score=7.72 TRINITY_DN8342_c0_g1_i1:232-609(-)